MPVIDQDEVREEVEKYIYDAMCGLLRKVGKDKIETSIVFSKKRLVDKFLGFKPSQYTFYSISNTIQNKYGIMNTVVCNSANIVEFKILITENGKQYKRSKGSYEVYTNGNGSSFEYKDEKVYTKEFTEEEIDGMTKQVALNIIETLKYKPESSESTYFTWDDLRETSNLLFTIPEVVKIKVMQGFTSVGIKVIDDGPGICIYANRSSFANPNLGCYT